MLKHRDLTIRRLQAFAGRLEEAVYPETATVDLAAYAAPGRISYAEAMGGGYRPIAPGYHFTPLWSTHWVSVAGRAPEGWAGREVHLRWDSCSEACVWQEGKVVQGLSPRRHTACRLVDAARGGEEVGCYVEVACNGLFGAEDAAAALQPGEVPDIGLLRRAELAVFEPGAWDLLWDLVVVLEMARELPEGHPRAGQALRVANEMVNRCDLGEPATWPEARRLGEEVLAARAGEGAFRLSAIGHAHIDTAWLWPLAETERKCYRSFSTALRYMESYPRYRFTCSQAQQWEWMKEKHPDVYVRMAERAREGRFVPAGGSWVEPDCNVPSGESLVRQFLFGKRFFEQELGIACREFWNPDVFGYSAQLPQILKQCEFDYFLTQKLSWNQFNRLPHHTFYWEGIDGSRVLTHFPPADSYNAQCTVKEVLATQGKHLDHDRSRHAYHLFGVGDGGGGPTREMLERLRRMTDVDGLPRLEPRTPAEFFRILEREARDLQTWTGELYLELHRGTYTTHARVKRDNRRSELLLRDIECLAALTNRAHYPRGELDRLWKLVLVNQFHDIIPGSSIRQVYEDAGRHYEEVLASGGDLRERLVDALAAGEGRRLLVVNTLTRPRREVVELPPGVDGAQPLDGGGALGVVEAPALGYAVGGTASAGSAVRISGSGETFVLENDVLRAGFDRAGRLVSLYDRRTERENVPAGSRGNNLVLFEDTPVRWEAWDVDAYHLEQREEVAPARSATVVEEGPLRVALRFEYDIGDRSALTQTVRLTALGARLDFVTEVAWRESRRFLKAEFPWNLRSDNATYEIQFGHIRRPTHFNTSWDLARFEVCAHRWADLSEADYGVALLNDCKYGYATHGNVMRLSLLRASKHPDPEADMGDHRFTYAVFPHPGSLQEAGVIDEAARLNTPLLLRTTSAEPVSRSWFSLDRDALVIDTVKQAEDTDAIVLRLYESHGTRGRARLASALPVKSAHRCNALERDDRSLTWEGGGVSLDYGPFEIITLKLGT